MRSGGLWLGPVRKDLEWQDWSGMGGKARAKWRGEAG